MGAVVTTVLFLLAVALGALLAPATGTPRPTNLDLLLRVIPVAAVVCGAYVGTHKCVASRLWQGVATIVMNWLVLTLVSLIADRIRGDDVFDPAASFVTAAPWFIFLGAIGVAAAGITDRRARQAISGER